MLSGIEINQNQTPADSGDNLTPSSFTYQTFNLPNNYKRVDVIPDITGVQICANISDADLFSLNLRFEIQEFGDWVLLEEGSIQQAPIPGQYAWVPIYFNSPIGIGTDQLTKLFRIGVQSDTPVWYSIPPPLVNQTTVNGGNLMFRLMANTADSGTDFLGDSYRSVAISSKVDSIDTSGVSTSSNFWLSKPNPSKFAVENIYFDISDGTKSTVVDRVLLDPITPGIFFNIYHSEEGDPGNNDQEWEQKLWKPTYQIFKADRRQEHALNTPITARYVKIEFTHLQAQSYQAGTFHQSIQYKKFPKWVIEYFTAQVDSTSNTDDFNIAQKVQVFYNSLSLAYNHVTNNLVSEPIKPVQDSDSVVNSVSDNIDQNTLNQINTSLKPFTNRPSERVKSFDSMLAAYVESVKDLAYPVEKVTRAIANVTQVSSLDRTALVIENNMPVMFFYITCRHTYRELLASFEEDRAYFAGVRELALIRDHYTSAHDSSLYVESLSDYSNVVRNDFLPET